MESTTVLLELWRVARLAGSRLDEALADSPIGASDFGLYSVLRYRAPLTPTALARHAGTPATTTSQALRRLESRGHLERREHPDDARSQLLALTRRGVQAHERAATAFRPVLAAVQEELGDELPAVLWALQRLDRVLGGSHDGSSPAGELPAPHTLPYTGAPLTVDEREEVDRFIDWLHHRRAG